MPIVEIEKGYKINYIEKGTGKNLVYIHGFLGCSWIYEEQVDYFSKNYRVIAIDHLGHGKSDKPEGESYELIDLARYFDQALSKIIGDEKIILHGHSMGGMIALTYATTPELARRLDGLVLMGTAPKLKNPGLVQYIEDLSAGKMKFIVRDTIENIHVPLCFYRKYRKDHPKLMEEFIQKTLENEEFIAFNTMNAIVYNYNVEDKLHTINVPTLILTGDKDLYILPQESNVLNEKIPKSKLVVFSPKIGHMVNFEAQEEYYKVLSDFLENI